MGWKLGNRGTRSVQGSNGPLLLIKVSLYDDIRFSRSWRIISYWFVMVTMLVGVFIYNILGGPEIQCWQWLTYTSIYTQISTLKLGIWAAAVVRHLYSSTSSLCHLDLSTSWLNWPDLDLLNLMNGGWYFNQELWTYLIYRHIVYYPCGLRQVTQYISYVRDCLESLAIPSHACRIGSHV